MRVFTIVLVATLVVPWVGGCISGPDDTDQTGTPADRIVMSVVDATSGDPVAFAQGVAFIGADPAIAATTSPNGTLVIRSHPGVDEIVVHKAGYRPVSLAGLDRSQIRVELEPDGEGDGEEHLAGLSFEKPVNLGTRTYPVAVGTACMEDPPNEDCGLGEPSVEVDAAGTIYLSGVCCIGAAPPVLVSRDDGETFETLETPTGIREAFGIEGDFAIDADGTVYFVDIELAATFQVTAWDKDGEYLHHTKWPAPPLVDRPWIRAGESGEVYYVYNTGSETNVYTSEDGARTWSPVARISLPYALGNAIKGPAEGELWVVGGDESGKRRVDYTMDGGASWETETTTSPSGGSFPVGHFDEAGNLYLVANEDDSITVARRDISGDWQDPSEVTPSWGTHRFPWLAAGGEGRVAVAWYGTVDDEVTRDSEWFLFVAVSLDAHEGEPHWAVTVADPVPVLVGDLERQLLDFLQVEVGPDDAVHVGYSKVLEPGEHEQLHYVRSDRLLPLSAAEYFWGPHEGSGGTVAGARLLG